MKLTPSDLRRTADAMEAYDAGKPVQIWDEIRAWIDCPNPNFVCGCLYRPKPFLPDPPKFDRVKAAQAIGELRKALNL